MKFIPEKAEPKEETTTTPQTLGVTKYMMTSLYISHVIWFCFINIRVNVFNGTIVPQLMDIYPDNKDKGKIWKGEVVFSQQFIEQHTTSQ